MIKSWAIAIFVLCLLVTCVAPKQPPLNDKEKKFIAEVENIYNGTTNRYIDAILLGANSKSQTGSYSLNTILACETLYKLGMDSVKIQSKAFAIAKKMYTEVLEGNIQYSKIWVSFSCDTSSSKYKDLVFVFKSDTLSY